MTSCTPTDGSGAIEELGEMSDAMLVSIELEETSIEGRAWRLPVARSWKLVCGYWRPTRSCIEGGLESDDNS